MYENGSIHRRSIIRINNQQVNIDKDAIQRQERMNETLSSIRTLQDM